MRIRIGGTVVDLRRTWSFFMLLGFLLLGTVFFFKLGPRDRNPPEFDASVFNANENHEGAFKKEHVGDGLGLLGPQQGGGYRKNQVMAMDAVRADYQKIIKVQRNILKSQKRPPDSQYNINVTLSDRISMDRRIEDTRPPPCKDRKYKKDLPKASVIIPFYNEALSMLLRTIHSLLNNSPDDLLNEIILVDDCSTRDYLGESFAKYVTMLPKVLLIRNSHRDGLIRSRMRGSKMARGPVVIFLDAHTEANVGWLEPLLYEIQQHPNTVAQPFVDGIDAMSIDYSAPPTLYVGSFSWDLRYTWLRLPEHEAQKAVETGLPYFSPTLVGCAIAVDKEFFEQIGQFDEGLKVWGGENIELGFRAWQCGGRVVTVMCSRVGHVFKNFPYKFDGDKEVIVAKNLMRVTETWMDSYRKFFYASSRTYEFKRVEFTPEEWASVNERRALRKRLECKNFEWYMYNIIPQLPTPRTDAVYYGEIQSMRSNACWDVLDDYYIGMNYLCFEHKIIPRNFFSLTEDGLLRYKDKCVHINPPEPVLRLLECPTADKEKFGVWSLDNGGHTYGRIVAKHMTPSGKWETFCITQVTNVYGGHQNEQMPELAKCDGNNEFQKWAFTWKFSWDQVPQHVRESRSVK